MAIGQKSIIKSLVQSSITSASFLFATQSTELFLLAVGAYLAAIRGSGWSPSLDFEAQCAARSLKLRQDFVVIDAGANMGNWLTAFRKRVTSEGLIYAFEPQPSAAAKIRELNLDRCEVIEAALGEHPGIRTLFTSQQTDTTGSLFERHDTVSADHNYRAIEVEVVRLDDFITQKRIDRIDFMKMDLEGGEFEALKGATDCIRRGVLRAFSFEFGSSNVNSRVFFRDMFDLLEKHYDLFRVTPAGKLIHVKTYTEDYECFARATTYLAKRKECS